MRELTINVTPGLVWHGQLAGISTIDYLIDGTIIVTSTLNSFSNNLLLLLSVINFPIFPLTLELTNQCEMSQLVPASAVDI